MKSRGAHGAGGGGGGAAKGNPTRFGLKSSGWGWGGGGSPHRGTLASLSALMGSRVPPPPPNSSHFAAFNLSPFQAFPPLRAGIGEPRGGGGLGGGSKVVPMRRATQNPHPMVFLPRGNLLLGVGGERSATVSPPIGVCFCLRPP